MFLKSKLSESHNWLLHHNYIKNVVRVKKYIYGNILDIGCGIKPYKEYFQSQCKTYVGLEYIKTIHGFKQVDVIANSMKLPFKDSSFDSVLSFQVMEHVPEPELFLNEAYRILKQGNYFFLTTPFMWGEHEIPNDFYRYTRYGLKYLAEKTGFEVIEIIPDSKYWTMAMLRFNYYLLRFARGKLKIFSKILMTPIFFISQLLAFFLDKLPHNYTVDTLGFSTLLKKPN